MLVLYGQRARSLLTRGKVVTYDQEVYFVPGHLLTRRPHVLWSGWIMLSMVSFRLSYRRILVKTNFSSGMIAFAEAGE